MRLTTIVVATLFAWVVGCRSDTGPQQMDRPSQSTSVRGEADALDGIVTDIQGAATPQREADALRRLRKYEIDRGLTYTIHAFRTSDNASVQDASTRLDPVRVEVTVFRGRDLVRAFQFVPKDNRNLVLLGE